MRRQLAGIEEGSASDGPFAAAPPRQHLVRLLLLAMATLLTLVVAQIVAFGSASIIADTHTSLLVKSALQANSIQQHETNATMRFAYVFYITQDIYGCSALHLMDNLVNKLSMDTSRIDLVVIYTSRLSQRMRSRMEAAVPVKFIEVPTINADDRTNDFWLESLTKLNAFKEWGYERVVYLDADGVPHKNLDHLFELPPATLYAPIAYWLPQPFFTSVLMVIEPSNALFDTILSWARNTGAAAG